MLHVKLPFNTGETAPGYASRYANRCGCRSAADFCGDIGTTFFAIIAGAEEGLAWLADASGVSIATLSASSIQRRNGGGYLLSGQHLTKGTLNTRCFRVCPICLQEDMQQNPDLEFAAPWCRAAWLISAIRTCPKHEVELVYVMDTEKSNSMSFLARYDFTNSILPVVSDQDALSKMVKRRIPSQLERYLSDRLNGVLPKNSWLNEFPFHAAARACEVVGAFKRHGLKAHLDGLTEDEWHIAGADGFDLLTEGAGSFRTFLEALRPNNIDLYGAARLKALFGRLYLWLRNIAKDPAYDLLRDVLREVAFDTVEMGPEEVIFDRPVGKRRLHSVRSAGDEIGMHYPRLAKYLRDAGFIEPDQIGKPANSVLIRVDDQLEAFLKRLNERLGIVEAAKYINATRTQFEQLLKAGLIRPVEVLENEANDAFVKAELDDFLVQLMAKAIEGEEWGPRAVTISQAARKLACKNLPIVQLILEGKVKSIGYRPGTAGLNALILDYNEVQSVLKPAIDDDQLERSESDPMSPHEVAQKTGWTRRVVATLVQQEWLPSHFVDGLMGNSVCRIWPKDLEAFDTEYIHAFALAKHLGVSRQRFKGVMMEAGISPTLDCTPAIFYRRDDVTVM